MKRLSLFLAVLLLGPTTAFAQWGNLPFLFRVGVTDTGSATSFTLDSNFVCCVTNSGDGYVIFFPGRAQTSGTFKIYAQCTSSTGTPDLSSAAIYATATGANDPDRADAGSSALYTSSNTDASACGTSKWLTYSFTGVTFTPGAFYVGVVKNDEAVPTSDYFAIQTRGALDGSDLVLPATLRSATTTDGFTTDPTIVSAMAPVVLKYDDGSVLGNPFVATSTPASNTNFRGMRVNFSEDVSVLGFWYNISSTAINAVKIYQGSTEVASVTTDPFAEQRASAVYFPPTTLTGGLDYDFVVEFATASTAGIVYTMGTSPPADVAAINPNWSYVNGATAGSFTETTDAIFFGAIMLADNPAITGGSGGSFTFVQ